MFFRNSPPDCFGGYVQLDFICCLWGKTLVFPHTPLALFGRFDCAPARRVAALRAEVSPDGDEGAALDSQGGRVPLDSRFGIAVSGTLAAKL